MRASWRAGKASSGIAATDSIRRCLGMDEAAKIVCRVSRFSSRPAWKLIFTESDSVSFVWGCGAAAFLGDAEALAFGSLAGGRCGRELVWHGIVGQKFRGQTINMLTGGSRVLVHIEIVTGAALKRCMVGAVATNDITGAVRI